MSVADWIVVSLVTSFIALFVYRLANRPFCSYCYEPEGDCEPDCPYFDIGGRIEKRD